MTPFRLRRRPLHLRPIDVLGAALYFEDTLWALLHTPLLLVTMRVSVFSVRLCRGLRHFNSQLPSTGIASIGSLEGAWEREGLEKSYSVWRVSLKNGAVPSIVISSCG